MQNKIKLDQLEKSRKLHEKNLNEYKNLINNKLKELNEAIMKEFELIEDKCFNSLKIDILKQVNNSV
jgi:hypothetical protein